MYYVSSGYVSRCNCVNEYKVYYLKHECQLICHEISRLLVKMFSRNDAFEYFVYVSNIIVHTLTLFVCVCVCVKQLQVRGLL